MIEVGLVCLSFVGGLLIGAAVSFPQGWQAGVLWAQRTLIDGG